MLQTQCCKPSFQHSASENYFFLTFNFLTKYRRPLDMPCFNVFSTDFCSVEKFHATKLEYCEKVNFLNVQVSPFNKLMNISHSWNTCLGFLLLTSCMEMLIFIYKQDLAPGQTAKGTKSWFNKQGAPVLEWPTNSSYMKHIKKSMSFPQEEDETYCTRPNRYQKKYGLPSNLCSTDCFYATTH